MKILVTGGAGFIGSHVVDEYLLRDYEVIVIDNLSTGGYENLNPRCRFIELDIREKEKVAQILKREKPDYVNHHAAQTSVANSVRDPLADAEVNILATLNLLECCCREKVKKFIFASSGGTIYGEVSQSPREDFPLTPLSPYGISKAAIEFYLAFYFRHYGLKYVSLRYANVYGPRQDPTGEAGVIAIFTRQMLEKKTPTIFGDGETVRDYVYCADVAQANLLATEREEVGVYNVGTGIGTTVNDIYQLIAQTTKFQGSPQYDHPRPGDLRRSILEIEKIQRELCWEPQVFLPEGINQTVEYFQAQILTQKEDRDCPS